MTAYASKAGALWRPGLTYIDVMKWDRTIAVGDEVVVRWTNCGSYHSALATVALVHNKSVRVTLDEGDGDYPARATITAPRPLNTRKWSWNNCVLPRAERSNA
jgi:hypothetical protein